MIDNQKMEQVSGIFNSSKNLEPLIDGLRSIGIQNEDLNIVMSDQTKEYYESNSDNISLKENVLDKNKMSEGLST